MIWRVAALALPTLLAAETSRSFSHVQVGQRLQDREMPVLGGQATQPLLGRGQVTVFVFFRPEHDHSLKTLGQLAALEQEFQGKPVRFVAVTSSSYGVEEVRGTVTESGIRMPVLVDKDDELYGELGVALHPVVGIADTQQRLAGYQHFLQINMREVLRAKIQFALGEVSKEDVARAVAPPRATTSTRSGAARRWLEMAKGLHARGRCDEAKAAIAQATKLDASLARAGDALGPCPAPAAGR
jgi:hypothetical protein